MKQSATIHALHPAPTRAAPKNAANGISTPASNKKTQQVYFSRQELQILLNIYGRYVSDGKWKDYAMDMLSDMAIFSVFQRSSEAPVYRIIKDPALSRKQGAWRIVSMSGQIVKRGHDLTLVMRYFED